MGNKKEEA